MPWDSIVGGLLGSPLLVLACAVVGRIWPEHRKRARAGKQN